MIILFHHYCTTLCLELDFAFSLDCQKVQRGKLQPAQCHDQPTKEQNLETAFFRPESHVCGFGQIWPFENGPNHMRSDKWKRSSSTWRMDGVGLLQTTSGRWEALKPEQKSHESRFVVGIGDGRGVRQGIAHGHTDKTSLGILRALWLTLHHLLVWYNGNRLPLSKKGKYG